MKKAKIYIKEADYYIKKAMNPAEEAMSYLDDCSSNNQNDKFEDEEE